MKVNASSRSLPRAALAVVIALVASLAIAACGGSSSTNTKTTGGSQTTSGTKTSAASGGFAEAKTLAAQFKVEPTSIGITQPIGKAIPKNKTIVLIGAGAGGSGTQATYAGFKQAAKYLGWTVKQINPASPTPQLMQAALNSAMQLNPSGVVISAIPVAIVQKQLAELKAKHVPVISTTGPDDSSPLLDLQLMGTIGLGQMAKAVAVQTLANMGKPGTVGMIGIQGYAIINNYSQFYAKEIKRLCPSCTIKSMEVTLASLGTTDGSDIVNWLRANPDVNALFVGWDGMDTNLFSAAKQAGVTLPKTYSNALVLANLPVLKSGELTASSAFDVTELGWRVADAFARIFTGQLHSAQTQDIQYPRPVIWSQANGNVPTAPSDGSYPPVVKNYQQAYLKLWGK